MMQEYVFVLLMQTGTAVAKVLQFFTRKPYNHASIALDLTLEEMYSFCRNQTRFPLPAGFNQEIVGQGTLGQFAVIPCEIYAIPITAEKKQEFCKNLEFFKQNRTMFSYNVLGLGTTFLRIKWTRKNKMHCSQFVATLLAQSGVKLNKPLSLHTPDDLRYISDANLIYRGELNRFYHTYAKSIQEEALEPESISVLSTIL
jgi:hypothetical protein